VPSTAGLILLRVAYDLDQSGADSVVVTQADLGRSLNATVRTIRRGLRALSDLGLIETAFVYDDGFRTGTRVSLGDSFPTSA
jgi:DNA-binding MarR family transcriptional regulator